MGTKIKNCKMRFGKMILGILFIVSLFAINQWKITKNITPISAKAESYSDEFLFDNWEYFCYLEETYRNQNPNATYDEMVLYLEGKISQAEQNGIIIPVGSSYQEKYERYKEKWDELNDEERSVVFQHPIAALTALNTSTVAREKTEILYGNPNCTDDNGDAFRHAYWNALMTKWIGAVKAEAFASAHEYGQTGLSSQMDLTNNERGRNDGLTYSYLEDSELAYKIAYRVSCGMYEQIVDGALVDSNIAGLLDEYVTLLFENQYTITLHLYDGMTHQQVLNYGDTIEISYAPSRPHYEFKGYYEQSEGRGLCYVTSVLGTTGNFYEIKAQSTGIEWNKVTDGDLYAHWELLSANYEITVVSIGEGNLSPRTVSLTSGYEKTLTADVPNNYTFDSWSINGVVYTTENVTYTFQLHRSYITGEITIYASNYSGSAAYRDGNITLYLQKNENCVAQGTLITLADGSQVPVESLTGNEMLLVWNLHTGSFDVAPILFIDHDQAATYEIINLQFSDGTQVKVIYEHAFWDFDLNKYVFLRADAAQYIGHWFNKQTTDEYGNMVWTSVQLTGVTITEEYTTAWSPVTYGHLCIYVNGMLSMPGATEGLINIFEVDGDIMQIDQEQYLADVASYGLFTYEEFAQIYPIPEEIFEAFNGQYLKISIGKGLIDYESLGELIERYESFFA